MSHQAGYRNILSEATSCFLSPEVDFLLLKQACDRLFNVLVEITALDEDRLAHQQPLLLSSGKSIGPFSAARCLNDLLRTKKFVRGLYQGIRAAQAQFPGKPIHILYAGTGPFATLALPMTQVFSPQEIQFTLLEIQPESASMLEKTISALHIEAYIHKIAVADAALFRTAPEMPVHVLLTETMQRALETEPQVAITLNLVPQLAPGGILIPERIEVWAGLLDPKRHMSNLMHLDGSEGDHILLKKIFALDQWTAVSPPKTGWFPPVEVLVELEQFESSPVLCLFTEIRVYGDEVIRKDESGLTNPLMLPSFSNARKLSFQYSMNEDPRFYIETVE